MGPAHGAGRCNSRHDGAILGDELRATEAQLSRMHQEAVAGERALSQLRDELITQQQHAGAEAEAGATALTCSHEERLVEVRVMAAALREEESRMERTRELLAVAREATHGEQLTSMGLMEKNQQQQQAHAESCLHYYHYHHHHHYYYYCYYYY